MNINDKKILARVNHKFMVVFSVGVGEENKRALESHKHRIQRKNLLIRKRRLQYYNMCTNIWYDNTGTFSFSFFLPKGVQEGENRKLVIKFWLVQPG